MAVAIEVAEDRPNCRYVGDLRSREIDLGRMKKITLENYQTDKYYPRITRAVDAILSRGDVVAPIDVFIGMSLLTAESVEEWRRGRVPCLEMRILCNLSAAGRILRILRMHVHDLKLWPSMTVYMRHGKGAKTRLPFSKSGAAPIEEAYSRHFVRVRSKRRQRETPLPEGPVEPEPAI
jgi:hypothetical protein